MTTMQIEVTSQVVGERDDSLKMKPVWVLVDVETITVREIIARAVEEQIKELYGKNRKVDMKQARRMLIRQYMSQDDLDTEAPPLAPSDPKEADLWEQKIKVKDEIKRAEEAFDSGRVVMIVNGEQVHNLEDQIIMTEDMKVKFIRLTPLVGG
jgi:hypothetical protein